MNAAIYRDASAPIEARVADLLGVMTLEEKVAQLGAIWAERFVNDDAFDAAATQDLLVHGIGQVTRIGASTGLLPQDSAAFLNAIQRVAVEKTRLGIPVLVHEEAVGGFLHRGATVFPQGLGLAASWNPALVRSAAQVIREQMVAVGARLALAPVLDVARDPRWGRVEETYGESPELSAAIGTAFVQGLQSSDLREGVVCAAKHFLGYGYSIGGRNQAPVHLGNRELRDVYAYPFAVAIRDAGLAGIMNSYTSIDGRACAGSREILTGLLRDELGFDGCVVADYGAVEQLFVNHRTAADRAEAALQAIAAGLDVELPALDCFLELPGLVDDGRLDIEVIDLAVERVLTQKFRLGLFEQPYVDASVAASSFDTAEQRALAHELAAQSVCVLTNDGALPLQPDQLRRVAVIGPHADDPRLLQGDYHYPAHLEILDLWEKPEGLPVPATIDGSPGVAAASGEESSFRWGMHYTNHMTPLAGLRVALGDGVAIDHMRGCHDTNATDEDIAAAVGLAKGADVAILFVGSRSGLTPDCTTGEMRDVVSLDLPGAQQELVEAVSATGTPTVVVVISGRVHTLGRMRDAANALVWCAPPGEEGGNALADVLTGAVNPSGRLPVTLPRHVGQVPIHHDMRARGDRAEIYTFYVDSKNTPLFPFGHGLSYTQFEYQLIDAVGGTTETGARIAVQVTNTGSRSGEEVVQLYCRDDVASVARPDRELIGFTRVLLEPGEGKHVSFEVPASRLAFHDAEVRRVTEPGTFTFFVGSSSSDIRAETTIDLTGRVAPHPITTSASVMVTVEDGAPQSTP